MTDLHDHQEWPHYPDPAELPPEQRPGVTVHMYAPNQLHTWLSRQAAQWVDLYGNVHEVRSLSPAYAANVIRFCQERAERIRALVAADDIAAGLAPPRDDHDASERDPDDALDWLETTPLFKALRRQLADRTQ